MNRDRYLDRLRISNAASLSPNAKTLARLQRQHLLTVPFTNFYVHNDEGTTLQPDTAVSRALDGGGLCYDLNSAFAWLLDQLGYDVVLLSGRVKQENSFSPEFDHLALLVEDHLVDVGFGDFARQPLPLSGEPQNDVSGTYRVLDRGKVYAAQEQANDSWADVYRFERVPQTREEFAEMAEYHSRSPESPFTGKLLATRAIRNGRVTLSGSTLTTTAQGESRKETLSDERVSNVLRDQFELPSW